ncbi:MAG: hypothetical protein ACTSRG_02005 [Candidatus Helarchaeota archaeon]
MERKWETFLIIGAIFIVVGVLFLYFGYQIFESESFRFKVITLVIFMQTPPLPHPYYLNLYFVFYKILLDLIQNYLGPFLFSFGIPFFGFVGICFGGICIVLAIINIRRQYFQVNITKKMDYATKF